MADFTSQFTFADHARSGFQRALRSIANGFEQYAKARSRVEQIEKLEAKSDAELAKMGIARDQIAYHVFRDLFYV